jgi:hypothetical protein
MLRRGHQCGMSVFTAKTTYDFVAGRRKLFLAGCACFIPGVAFCVEVSWLAVGKNWGPAMGRLVLFVQPSNVMDTGRSAVRSG